MAQRRQRGWLKKEKRVQGETWVLYFRTRRESDGRRVENKIPIGLVRDVPDKERAWAQVERLHLKLNRKCQRNPMVDSLNPRPGLLRSCDNTTAVKLTARNASDGPNIQEAPSRLRWPCFFEHPSQRDATPFSVGIM